MIDDDSLFNLKAIEIEIGDHRLRSTGQSIHKHMCIYLKSIG